MVKSRLLKNIIFFGNDRKSCLDALNYLVGSEINLEACVIDNSSESGNLFELCLKLKIKAFTPKTFIEAIDNKFFKHIDYGISYLHHRLITKKEIKLCNYGIINFHPAPLPDHKGLGGSSYAILSRQKTWGVTAHFIDEGFDEGNIISINRFPIDEKHTTGIELSKFLQVKLFDLFKNIIKKIIDNSELISSPQKGKGFYYSKKDMEYDKCIYPEDTIEDIDYKIRAFWFPPYKGASIEIKGKKYMLINDLVLQKIEELYHFQERFLDEC